MPLKLQTRLSTKYLPSQHQVQNQEGPTQENLSFDRHLVGVVSNGYIEFKSFIFSDSSTVDFKTTTKDSEFKEHRLSSPFQAISRVILRYCNASNTLFNALIGIELQDKEGH